MFSPFLNGVSARMVKASVYPSPPEGFLINDYDNRIGKKINEKIRVKYAETAGVIWRFEDYGEEKYWEAKLRRGWFQDYLEVFPPKDVENDVVFCCDPPVEVSLGFNRYFYCGWLPAFLAILGGVGYWVYKKTWKTKKDSSN
jgi:hypothetical protein